MEASFGTWGVMAGDMMEAIGDAGDDRLWEGLLRRRGWWWGWCVVVMVWWEWGVVTWVRWSEVIIKWHCLFITNTNIHISISNCHEIIFFFVIIISRTVTQLAHYNAWEAPFWQVLLEHTKNPIRRDRGLGVVGCVNSHSTLFWQDGGLCLKEVGKGKAEKMDARVAALR